jgi:uncharacterized membrane protein YphA (DoxX/SURF4 family)
VNNIENRLNTTWWVLRLTFGLVPVVAGLDKFLNLLTSWASYLSPAFVRMLPVSASTFMHLVGVVEIAAGVLVLSRLTKLASYVVMGWLIAIALNLVAMKLFDVAVRDVVMALGAYALGQLTAMREELGVESRAVRTRTIAANA